jgi:hypothetical protein
MSYIQNQQVGHSRKEGSVGSIRCRDSRFESASESMHSLPRSPRSQAHIHQTLGTPEGEYEDYLPDDYSGWEFGDASYAEG